MENKDNAKTNENPKDGKHFLSSEKIHAILWEALGLGIVIIVGALILGGLMYGIKSKQKSLKEKQASDNKNQKTKSVPVMVTKLEGQTFVDNIVLPGIIRPWAETQISAQVTGKVVKLPVEEGTHVGSGKILCKLEDKDYAIALAQAKAAFDLAEKNLKRTKELFAQDIRTHSEFDADLSAYDQAKTRVEAAKLALRRCTIKSPTSGEVEEIMPEIGELINPSDPVAKVLKIDKIKIEIGIPEQDIEAVRNLKECEVVVDSIGDGLKLKGKRIFLSRQTIQSGLVYLLRLETANKELLLRPGMFVNANIVKGIRENSIVVPIYAILVQNDKHYAFVIKKDGAETTAEKREVTLGSIKEREVEIRSGLKAGEQLIIMGQRRVADGTPVSVEKVINDIAELSR